MSDKKSALDVGLEMHEKTFKRIAKGFPVEMVGNIEFTSLWNAAEKISNKKSIKGIKFHVDPFGGGGGFHALSATARCSCSSKVTGQKCQYSTTPIFDGEAQADLLGAVFYSVIWDLRLAMFEKGCTCIEEPELLELQEFFNGDQND